MAVVTALARPTDASIIVADGYMRVVHAQVERVAASDISVLLLGETGVGKEIVAETLHRRSPRAHRPYLRFHCAALPEALLETELFGYEAGAFPGATTGKPGLLEIASGGTVFFDEIGEMQLALQAKLLRVLDERKVLRVGGLEPRPIDLRILSATNRDLEADVRAGGFRADLFYRHAGIAIEIPPLRERPLEVLPLARGFADAIAARLARRSPRISDDAGALLQRYPWPGNVRELRNAIERAVALCSDDLIRERDLPALAGAHPARGRRPLDRQRIVAALDACNGNQSYAAELLGVSRRTLITWIERFELPRPRKGRRRPQVGS